MVRRFPRVALVFILLGLTGGAGGLRNAAAQSTAATPAAGSPGTLAVMLDLAPDVLAGPAPPQFIASFADAAAQMAALGVTPPAALNRDDPSVQAWLAAASWLLLPSMMIGKTELWGETFGFDAAQIDQSLELGEPPDTIEIMRGRFDRQAITTALTANGYQTIDSPDATIYSLDPDGALVFASDAGRVALGRMDNVAILPDGTLICAATLDAVQQTIATALGKSPSLADRPEVRQLLAAQTEPLVSALLVVGTTLSNTIAPDALLSGTPVDVDALATQITRAGEMPPVALALLGVTAGGPVPQFGATPAAATAVPGVLDARFEIDLLMTDANAAETAARIASERLATGHTNRDGRQFSQLFATWRATAVSGTPVTRLELDFADGVSPGIWVRLFEERDLLFVAW